MKRYAALAGAILILWMATACNEPANTRDADMKAIRSIETQWNQDFASKDPDKLAAHYATNAVLMVPGMASSYGRDAIRTVINQMLADPALSLKFQLSKIDVANSGDLAYTQGSYTMTTTNPQTRKAMNDHGSYVTVYRKLADGSWKAISDISTSEVPTVQPTGKPGKNPVQKPAKTERVKKHHK